MSFHLKYSVNPLHFLEKRSPNSQKKNHGSFHELILLIIPSLTTKPPFFKNSMFLARHKCQTDVVRATLERSASKLCYRNLLAENMSLLHMSTSFLPSNHGSNHIDVSLPFANCLSTSFAKDYKEEWLEWLLAKICIEESYFSLLFVELGSLGVSITSNGPESHYTVFTYEQAFLCRILSKCMSQQSNEVTVSKEFALQILNILKEAYSIVDFTLRESSELPTGFPSIDILGYSIVMLRDICAWEGVPLYANESPIQSLLSAGIAEYFLNLLRELEPPAIIKKCIVKANIPEVKEKMADKVCPYKGYRRDLVSVIASCAYRRNHVQNEIREREGVYLILQQCVLDEDNPYLREWGMLAMSYLMWDNAEIVRELKELQLQAPVQTPEIAALGLEVVIDEETGRAKLVNTPSYTKDWEG